MKNDIGGGGAGAPRPAPWPPAGAGACCPEMATAVNIIANTHTDRHARLMAALYIGIAGCDKPSRMSGPRRVRRESCGETRPPTANCRLPTADYSYRNASIGSMRAALRAG